jgi:predicted nucleotidyltransferase
VTTLALGFLDARAGAYVVDAIRAIDASAPLVEAYLLGSGAVGGFDPHASDVDLVVVLAKPLGPAREEVVGMLTTLAWPARDLELVAYVQGRQPPDFELNVSRGAERPDEDAFWFVLDAAVAQAHAVPLLHGRGWTELFAPVPERRVREAAAESLAWAESRPASDEFARLHAARARHYLEHGEWISKREAAC